MNVVERVYSRYAGTRFPLPSEANIAALETKMGTLLPAEYRAFIANHNGGYFNDAPFEMNDDRCRRDALTTLWGVTTPQRGTDLINSLDNFDDNDPAIILPFGYTMMGNMLIMELKGEYPGEIILKLAFKQDYIYVASDFLRFMDLIGR